MKTSTRVFLVLLRLVIGWHLLFEGLSKFEEGTFSSEGYLRESTGPLAGWFRNLAGDPLADRLTPKPLPAGAEADKAKIGASMPPALDAEWNAYFDRFVSHYRLDANQREIAEEVRTKQKDAFMDWLVRSTREVTTTSPFGPPAKVELTVAERLKLSADKQAQAHQFETTELMHAPDALARKEANAKLRAIKGDANRVRAELRADLVEENKKFRAALYEKVYSTFSDAQRGLPPMGSSMPVGITRWTALDWADLSVQFGLIVLGFCLLAGLFTRPASLLAALMLLMFYLAMPPLPWVPDNPRVEGHYLFVNKNLIEMLALLTLATVPSGRWLGLDALLWMAGQRRRPAPPSTPATPTGA